MDAKQLAERLNRARPSYNYCGICGRQPSGALEEPNYGPLRYWDCDDGWRIGTLCRWCAEDALPVKPSPDDYAYEARHGQDFANIDTDEDPLLAL